MKKKVYKTARYKFLCLVLVVVVIGLGATTLRYRDLDQISQENNNQIDRLLYGLGRGVEGQACGILSQDEAEAIIGPDAKRDSRVSRQGFSSLNSVGSSPVHWSDSCTYQDENNSTRYVELYINTYQTVEEATVRLRDFLPQVGSVEPVSQYATVDEGVYDAGVHYARNDREVIRVAAGNGIPSESKDFGYVVLQSILEQMSYPESE